MNNSELFALLGVIGTFVVPIVAIYLQKENDRKSLIVLSESRRIALKGDWEGVFKVIYSVNEEYIHQPFKMKLFPGRKLIKGTVEFKSIYSQDRDELVNFILIGGFRYDRFLVLDYNNKKRIQFGTLLLELSPSNIKLHGRLVGFGALSEKILFGEVEIQKINKNAT